MTTNFDYVSTQAEADALIRFFGMGAVLRRKTGATSTDRPCSVCIIEYNPREKPADLANPTDRKVILSPIDPSTGHPLAIVPDNEQDVLVTFVQPLGTPPIQNEVLPLTCKPKPTAPAGVTVLWEFTVRR
jgi:hypothetical protein